MSILSPDSVPETTESFRSAGRAVPVERFEPAGGGRGAPVLLLHGADGLAHHGGVYRGFARTLAADGHVAFLAHYFDGGGPWQLARAPLHFLTWLQTVTDAVTHAAAGVEPVGVVGFSLGAYLALAAASQDRRIGAVVECFGGLPDLLAHAITHMPPVLILHGDADAVVPVSEARKLEQTLRGKGLSCETCIYAGAGHVFHGPIQADAMERARRFLDRRLRRQDAPPTR